MERAPTPTPSSLDVTAATTCDVPLAYGLCLWTRRCRLSARRAQTTRPPKGARASARAGPRRM